MSWLPHALSDAERRACDAAADAVELSAAAAALAALPEGPAKRRLVAALAVEHTAAASRARPRLTLVHSHLTLGEKLLVLALAAKTGYERELDACVGLCRDSASDTAPTGLLAITIARAAAHSRVARDAWEDAASSRAPAASARAAARDAALAAAGSIAAASDVDDYEVVKFTRLVKHVAVRGAVRRAARDAAATAATNAARAASAQFLREELAAAACPRQWTRLHQAVHRAACVVSVSRLTTLLRAGADACSRDATGRTPLSLLTRCSGWAACDSHGRQSSAGIACYNLLLRAECTAAAQTALDRTLLVLGFAAEAGYSRDVGAVLATCRQARSDAAPHFPLAEVVYGEGKAARAGALARTRLHWSASRGDVARVRTLLKMGAAVNAVDMRGRTPLYHAACNGRRAVVSALLATPSIDVNLAVEVGPGDGSNPLIAAILNGNTSVALALLAVPAIHVNAREEGMMFALHAAAKRGDGVVVDALLSNPGIDVNAVYNGHTALAVASSNYESIALALLLRPEINVNARAVDEEEAADGFENMPPLWNAALNGKVDVVNALLSSPHIDVNAQYDSCPSLWVAAANNHASVVRALVSEQGIARGIDVNDNGLDFETENTASPLSTAASRGHDGVVEALLAAPGIDVNGTGDFEDGPPALFAAVSEGHTRCIDMLLAAPGVTVPGLTYTIGENGDYSIPLLCAAARGGNFDVLNVLLNHRDVAESIANAPGVLINEAAWDEIAFEFDYDSALGEFGTALYIAAAKGRADMVSLLLAVPGIAPNAGLFHVWTHAVGGVPTTTRVDATPLHAAAAGGHTAVVELLLAAPGVDAGAVNEDGQTPLQVLRDWRANLDGQSWTIARLAELQGTTRLLAHAMKVAGGGAAAGPALAAAVAQPDAGAGAGVVAAPVGPPALA